MNKKQLAAFLQSLVARVQSDCNAGEGSDEPELTESECRTLVGIYLRKNADTIVEACSTNAG